MAYCPKCGESNKTDARYCVRCGEPLSSGKQQKQKPKKECSLCHGTGKVRHPTGATVPYPNGCPGFYPH